MKKFYSFAPAHTCVRAHFWAFMDRANSENLSSQVPLRERVTRKGVRVHEARLMLDSRRRMRSIDFTNKLYDTPLLRGKIHILLFITAPLWATHMFRHCTTPWAKFTALMSIISCTFNFGSSAMLHNVHWVSVQARTFWRQLDHIGIFMMIIGSALPVPMLTFSPVWKISWITVQLILFGIGISLCYVGGDKFSNKNSYGARAAVYVVFGLLNLTFAVEFNRTLIRSEKWLLGILASCYVAGACTYALKRPNIYPSIFGYHECFHILCLVSGILTYCLNLSVIRRYEHEYKMSETPISQNIFSAGLTWLPEILTVSLMTIMTRISQMFSMLSIRKVEVASPIARELSPGHSMILRQMSSFISQMPSTPALVGQLSASPRSLVFYRSNCMSVR